MMGMLAFLPGYAGRICWLVLLDMMGGYVVFICWLAILAKYAGVNAVWQSWLCMLAGYFAHLC
jgi:hypothetical protein